MSEQNKPPVFSLRLEEYHFVLETEAGDEVQYKLVELDGTQRDAYLNAMSSKMEMRNGSMRIKSFDGLQAQLLSRCCYCKNPETGDWEKVTVQEIQLWPSRVTKVLEEQAKQMSGLDDDEDDKGDDSGN